MSVERYEHTADADGPQGDQTYSSSMYSHPRGDYVRFSDYEEREAELENEIKSLQKKIDDAISSLT